MYPVGIIPQILGTPSFDHKKFFYFISLFLFYVGLSRAEHCRRGSDVVCSAAVIPFTMVSIPGIKKNHVHFDGFVDSVSKLCFKLDTLYH